MFRSRRFYLSLLGVVACSATTADLVLSILDAISLSSVDVSFVALPSAATALEGVAFCCIALFSLHHAWRKEGLFKSSILAKRMLGTICVLLSATALVVSMISIITMKMRMEAEVQPTANTFITSLNTYIAGRLTAWILACLSQTLLYSAPFWMKSTPQLQSVTLSGPRDSVMSSQLPYPSRLTNLYTLDPAPPLSPTAALPSPTFSARSSQSLKSWRDSLQHVVRPVTSRTKLISRPSFNKDARSVYPEGKSVDNISQADGFDTWDTSDAVLPGVPSRGTALEPIPGSRPASPARALDGPFPQESDDEDLTRPPTLKPDVSRPPSPAVSEAHIHPLFRTETLTPPPAATPGTSITASPLASQMIPCPSRPYSRMRTNSMRSNSCATSPSPLVPSQSLRDRTISPHRSSRSPSPPTREMTPPIPDSVLGSSSRSSMHSQRKVKLQLESSPPASSP